MIACEYGAGRPVVTVYSDASTSSNPMSTAYGAGACLDDYFRWDAGPLKFTRSSANAEACGVANAVELGRRLADELRVEVIEFVVYSDSLVLANLTDFGPPFLRTHKFPHLRARIKEALRGAKITGHILRAHGKGNVHERAMKHCHRIANQFRIYSKVLDWPPATL